MARTSSKSAPAVTASTRASAKPAARPSPKGTGRGESLAVAPASWQRNTGQSEAERRRSPRVQAEFKARLYGGDGKGTYLEARLGSADVSLTGLFLRSTFFLAVDTPVRVEFDIPDIGPVVAEGRVARQQTQGSETGLGIEFGQLSEAALEALVSVFIIDEVQRFTHEYSSRQRASKIDREALLRGILAWEVYRAHLHDDRD